MKRSLVLAVAIAGCVSPLEPCVPQLGPGCRYTISVYDDQGRYLGYVRSQLYDPCLPKEVSDVKYPGWPVAVDTIKPCPAPRTRL